MADNWGNTPAFISQAFNNGLYKYKNKMRSLPGNIQEKIEYLLGHSYEGSIEDFAASYRISISNIPKSEVYLRIGHAMYNESDPVFVKYMIDNITKLTDTQYTSTVSKLEANAKNEVRKETKQFERLIHVDSGNNHIIAAHGTQSRLKSTRSEFEEVQDTNQANYDRDMAIGNQRIKHTKFNMGRKAPIWNSKSTFRKITGTAKAGIIGGIIAGVGGATIGSLLYIAATKLIKKCCNNDKRIKVFVKEVRDLFKYDPAFSTKESLEAAAEGLGVEFDVAMQRRDLTELIIAELVKYVDEPLRASRRASSGSRFKEVYRPSVAGNKICELIVKKTSLYWIVTGTNGASFEKAAAEYEETILRVEENKAQNKKGINRVAKQLFGKSLVGRIKRHNRQKSALNSDKISRAELSDMLFNILKSDTSDTENINTARAESLYYALFQERPKMSTKGRMKREDKNFIRMLKALSPDLINLKEYEEKLYTNPESIDDKDIRWFKDFDTVLKGALSTKGRAISQRGDLKYDTGKKDDKGEIIYGIKEGKGDYKVSKGGDSRAERALKEQKNIFTGLKGFDDEVDNLKNASHFISLGLVKSSNDPNAVLEPDFVMPTWIVGSNIRISTSGFENILYPKDDFVKDNKTLKYSGAEVDNNLYTLIATQTRILSNMFHLQYGARNEKFSLIKDSDYAIHAGTNLMSPFDNLGVINKPAEPVYVVNRALPVETDVYDLISLILSVIPGGAAAVAGLDVVKAMENSPNYANILAGAGGRGMRGKYEHGGNIRNMNRFTNFISGDSYINKSNPEQVSIDWASQNVRINPIPTLDQINKMPTSQQGSSPLSQLQREAPMAVGLVGGMLTYNKEIKGTSSQDNQALKVYSINNPFDESVLVGNEEIRPIEVIVEMARYISSITEMLIASNNTQNIISSASQALVKGLDRITNKIGENGRNSASSGIDIGSVLFMGNRN